MVTYKPKKKKEPETYEITIEVSITAIPELFLKISEMVKHGKLVSITNTIDVDDDIDI